MMRITENRFVLFKKGFAMRKFAQLKILRTNLCCTESLHIKSKILKRESVF